MFLSRGTCFEIFVCVVGIEITIVQGSSNSSILDCFTPIKLAYDIKEPSSGTNETLSPIIFLHAISCSKENWFEIPQIVANRTGRKVYNVDARNHGDSEYSKCFNFDINAKDVVQFMDELDIPKALLIGHSMGAESVVKVALTNPERVEKAIIEEITVSRLPTELTHTVAKYIRFLEEAAEHVPSEYDYNDANQYIQDYISGKPIVALTYGVSTGKVNKTRHMPLTRGPDGGYVLKVDVKDVLYSLRSSETLMSDNTGLYEGPSYFIYGEDSTLKVNEDASNILSHFPNAQFTGVKGSNHEVHNNFPKEYIEYILSFITQDNHDK